MSKKDLAYFKKRFARIRYYIGETFELKKKVSSVDALLSEVSLTPDLQARVNYYCQLNEPFIVSSRAVRNDKFVRTKSFAYFADLKRITRHFPDYYRFDYLFGDVVDIPSVPTFVKSRPICNGNENSVLLKLNAIRHYQFVEDTKPFGDKLPLAVWRGMVYHQHRREFVDRYYESKFANIGHNDDSLVHESAYKGFMSIQEQLNHRYIVSVEGKDVATNLKWAMASNSLVMMRKPKFETWFMEGQLIAGVHYVELKEDFSDLEEKVQFYNEHPQQAEIIVRNAQAYVKQFLDEKQELIVSLLVAQKYFNLSQLSDTSYCQK